MKLILQLKHWQLFLILLFFCWSQTRSGDGDVIGGLTLLLVLIGWTWSLGTHGQKVLAANNIARKSTGLFALNIAYLCVFFILLALFQVQHYFQPSLPQIEKALGWFGWGYAVFATIHATWFTARTLSMTENDGEYFWGTTVVYAFFLLVPILGIWVIQPIVNKWTQKPLYHENDGAGI
jgi:hypothetical protein